MSYGELNRRANQLARHLRNMGVEPEVLVGICMERSFEMVVGLLGILKAGGAYVPVDPSYPAERQSYMIEDSGAAVLLTQARLAAGLTKQAPGWIVVDTGMGGDRTALRLKIWGRERTRTIWLTSFTHPVRRESPREP